MPENTPVPHIYIDPNDPKYSKKPNLAATTKFSAPSQYDKGLLPGMDEEEYRSQRQPALDKLGNGLANMAASAFTGAASNTVGLVYGGLSALANMDKSKFWDNELNKSLESLTAGVRELAPFYYSEAEKNASVLGQMGKQNFWFDQVLGSSGYTVGSLLTGMGAARLFNIGKSAMLAQLGDEAIISGGALTGAAEGLGIEAAKKKGWDVAKEFTLGLTMANGESTMEALQTSKETEEFYKNARELGNPENPNYNPEYAKYADLTDEQIEQFRIDAGNTNYLANLAVTGGTNFMLLRHWLPGKTAAIKEYNVAGRIGTQTVEGSTQYFDRLASNKSNAFLNVGKQLVKGALPESGQEFLQFTSNIAAQEFVKNHSFEKQNWFNALTEGLGEGLSRAATEKEGLTAALIGGISGAPFGLGNRQKKAEDVYVKQLINNLNADPNFVQANPKIANALAVTRKLQTAEEHLQNADLFNAKNEADDALTMHIKGYIDAGTEDYFIARLESLKDAGNEELAKHFGEGATAEEVDKIIEKTQQLKKLNDDITTLYGVSGGNDQEKAYNAILREQLFFGASNIKDIEKRASNVEKDLTDLQIPEVTSLLSLRKGVFNIDKAIVPEGTLKKDAEEILANAKKTAVDTYNKALEEFQNTHPVEAAQVNQLLGDLNKLIQRKEEFVTYYNELNNPERAAKLLEATQKALQKNAEQQTAPTPQEIDNANKVVSINPNRQRVVKVEGKDIDIAKLDDATLEELSSDTDVNIMNAAFNQGQESEEYAAAVAAKEAFIEEAELRQNAAKQLADIEKALINAGSPEEVNAIIQQATDAGFTINAAEAEKLKKAVTKNAEVTATQQAAINASINPNFKGSGEFFEAFSEKNAEQLENYQEAIGREDSEKKFFFKVRRNPNPGVIISVGKDANPNIKKRTPELIIELWHGGEGEKLIQVGVMPWYGQYVTATGQPIDIANLTEAQYMSLFGPTLENLSKDPSKFSLQAFKDAHAKAASLYTQIQNILGDKAETTLSIKKSAELGTFSISSGNYNIEIKDFPLGDFFKPESKNQPYLINDTPLIISTSSYDGTSTDFKIAKSEITGNTAVASIRDAQGNPVVNNKLGDVRNELIPALQALKQRLTNPKLGGVIWNKYWMLVEDETGSITIEGSNKTYDWRPVTPAVLTTEERNAAFTELLALGEEAKTVEGVEAKERLTSLTRRAANKLFIALNTGTANKAYKNANVSFNTSKKGLGCTIEIQSYYGMDVAEGKAYSGKIYLDIPATVTTFEEFINFFNAELKKTQDFNYSVKSSSGDTIRSQIPISFNDNIQPISIRNIRKNFVGEGKNGIANINPSNVLDSFVGHIDPETPKINRKIKFESKTSTIAQVVPVPPPIAAPVISVTTDVITDEVYNTFVDKNTVSENILNSIADKVMNRVSLSQRETAIFTGKTSEINEIIKKKAISVRDIQLSDLKVGTKLVHRKNSNYTGKIVKIHADGQIDITTDKVDSDYEDVNLLNQDWAIEEKLATKVTTPGQQLAAIQTAVPADVSVEPATPVARASRKRQVDERAPEGGRVNARGFYSEQDLIDYEAAIAELRTMLPQEITIQELNQLGKSLRDGKITFGSFYRGVLELSRFAKSGIQYHEAFHAVFRSFLNDAQQDILYKEAKEFIRQELKAKGKSFNQGFEDFKAERLDYANVAPEILEKLYLEEWMADEFMKYKKGQSTLNKKQVTGIGSALKYLFEQIKKFANWLQGKSNLKDLFEQIEGGKFKEAKSVENRFSKDPRFDIKANAGIYVGNRFGSDGTEYPGYLDSQYETRLTNTVVANVLSRMESEGTSPSELISQEIAKLGELFNTENSIYDAIFEDPRHEKTRELLLDLDFMFNPTNALSQESNKDFRNRVEAKLKEYSVNEFEDSADETVDGSDNITERSFDLNNENKGGFSSLSKALRKYIATTTYVTNMDNFLGLPEGILPVRQELVITVDPKKVYDGIVKLAANQESPEAVLRKLNYFMKESGESPKFIEKFFSDSGIQFEADGTFTYNQDKTRLITMVTKGLSLHEVPYIFTEIDTRKQNSKTYESNRKNVDTLQVSAWNAAYTNIRSAIGVEGITDLVGKVNINILSVNTELTDAKVEELVTSIQKDLNAVGIKLSKMYLRYVVLASSNRIKNADQIAFITEFEDSVKIPADKVRESLAYVLNDMKQGVNPFQKTDIENDSVTRLKKIAKDNAVFDEEVFVTSMVNAEGKNIYPYQHANYHVAKFLKLRNIAKEFVNAEGAIDMDGLIKAIHTESPNQDYITENYLLSDPLFQYAMKSITIERVDGIRSVTLEEKDGETVAIRDNKAREGATYGSMTDRELYILMYSLHADNTTDIKTSDGTKRTMRRSLFNIMEASNTADVIRLPIKTLFSKGNITKEFIDLIVKEVQREATRIANVKNGVYTDQYVNFNAYAEEGKQRGRKFWENVDLLNSIQYTTEDGRVTNLREALEQDLTSLSDSKTMKLLEKGIEEHYINHIKEHLEDLKKVGILTEEGSNRLLNKKFEGGAAAENDPMFSGNTLNDNIANSYLNMYMNNTAVNHILMGDPALGLKNAIDWFKRARGNNASGPNMQHFIESENTPVKVVTFGRPDGKGGIDDFVNKDNVKPKERIYKVGSPEFEQFLNDMGKENNWTKQQIEEERARIIASDTQEIKVADAQCYCTVKAYTRFMNNLGKLTKRGADIYKAIEEGKVSKDGKVLSLSDWEYLKQNGLMMNSMKLVYYDGVTYVKMSVVKLSKEMTTDPDGTARKGFEFLHNLRLQMEESGAEMAGQPTMMKKMIKNPLLINEGQNDFTIGQENLQDLDLSYLRLQQENPSNKGTIKDPTQSAQLIAGEQDPNTVVTRLNGKEAKVGDIVKEYDALLRDRLIAQYNVARAYISVISNNKRTLNLKRAVKAFRKTLQETGASQQLLDYLEVNPDTGNPIFNLNEPAVVQAFEQHFNAFYNNIFSQKVPGYKVTLVAALNTNPIIEDTKTGKIITRNEYDADPAKYKNDPRYKARELAFDQPRIVNGKEVHRYSEVIIPHHFAELFGLKAGDEIPEALQYMFGTRIPSQDKHSSMVLRIADVLPPSYGSSMIAPHELILLTGSDFDIDSFFIHRMGHYEKNGKLIPYGNNEDSKWIQFKKWHSSENKMIKNLMDELSEDGVIKNAKAEIRKLYKKINTIKEIEDSLYDRGYAIEEGESALLQEKYDPETGESLEDLANKKKKELQEYKEQLLMAAFKELGLPTSEQEYNKNPMDYVGEINNKLLEAKMLLHTNKGMNDINKTPATLEAIKNVLTKLATELGYSNWEDLEKSYNPNLPMGQVKSFLTMKAGQVAIGAAVNNSQVYTVVTRFGLQKRKGDDVRDLILLDKLIDHISSSNFKTDDGVRIMDILSTLTSSMTDNTKYGYNSKMNIDIQTLGILSYLAMNRVPLEVSGFLINSEAIKSYSAESRDYAIQTEKEEQYHGNILDIIKNRYKKEAEALLTNVTPSDIQNESLKPVTQDDINISMELNPARKSFAELNSNQQAEEIKNMDPDKRGKYLIAQLRILNLYDGLINDSRELLAYSQILKLTKGISSSTKETSFKGDEDLKNHLKTLDMKLVKTREGWKAVRANEKTPAPMFDFTQLLNEHLITQENLNIFGEKTELQKEYFISQTNAADEARQKIAGSIRKKMKDKTRTKAMTEMRRNFESFLMAKVWAKNIKDPNEDLNAYLYEDIAKQKGVMTMEEIKEEIVRNNPELKHNMIFTQVFFKTKDGQFKLEFNTRTKGNKGFTTTLVTEMQRLYNSPAKPLVTAMLKHLMAKNALQFKNDSPISLITPRIVESIFNSSTAANEYTPILNTTNDTEYQEMFGAAKEELLDEFVDMFMRDINNRQYIHFVKKEALNPDSETAKSKTPVTKTSTGFILNLDAHVNAKTIDEIIADEISISTVDKDAKSLQYRRNFATFTKSFGFVKMYEEYEKITTDKNTGVKTKSKEKAVVFEFPKYIFVGDALYRLKSYTSVENRFAEKDRFTTKPNKEGQYVGTAAEYEVVTRFGGSGASPYGRTIAENEATSYEVMKAKKVVQPVEQTDTDPNEVNGDTEMVENVPAFMAEIKVEKPIEEAPISKEQQLVNKNMSTLVATSVGTTEVLLNNKAKLKYELKSMSNLGVKLASLSMSNTKEMEKTGLLKLAQTGVFHKGTVEDKQLAIDTLIDQATPEQAVEIRKLLCK